ncbi:hypothetical protein OG607_44100 [Streptomyces sp. NBC_01537]|uniref:GAP1-N2 domain-containing protein n=1 Tax=Streptomyces sp. NBC_01537 TaxID=2903896 RepID=UPI003862DDCF
MTAPASTPEAAPATAPADVPAGRPTGVEQLHYTWALSGMDGRAGFQRVAASPGLAATRSETVTAALRLCRYARPRLLAEDQEPPVAYGWTDLGAVRLVFHRSYAGQDGAGRPGNFRAHVLAGPRSALPVAGLVALLGSPFWWRGDGPDAGYPDGGARTLPMVSLADIAPGPPLPVPSTDELAGFIDALLTGGGRATVCVRRSPPEVLALAAEFGGRLPGVLERISLSTYETAKAAREFGAVGLASGEEPPAGAVTVGALPAVPPVVADARDLLMAPGQTEQGLLRAAALRASDGHGGLPVAGLLEGLAFARSLVRGVRPGPGLAARCLADPAAADYLIGLPESRAACAEALASGDRAAWDGLAAGLSGIPAGRQRELGRDVAGRAGDGLVDALVSRVHPVRTPFHHACLDELLTAAGAGAPALRTVRPGTRLALLTHAQARRPAPADAVDRLVREAGEGADAGLLVLAEATELPLEWRAMAVATALETAPARPAAAALRDLLLRHPALTVPAALQLTRAERLLTVLPPGPAAEPLVCDAARALGHEQRFRLLAAYRTQLGPSAALAFFAARPPHSRLRPAGPGWSAFVAADLAAVTAAALDPDSRESPVPSPAVIDLLGSVPGDATQAWAGLLTGLRPHDPDVTPNLDRLRQALSRMAWLPDPAARDTAFRLALYCWLRRPGPTPETLRDLVLLSGEARVEPNSLNVLTTAQLLARHGHGATAVPAALGCVALLIDSGRLRRRTALPFGKDGDRRPFDRLAAELAGQTASGALVTVLPMEYLATRKARKWWHQIAAP